MNEEKLKDESPASEFGQQGYVWEGEASVQLSEVIESAFDYRGNVTLKLRGGELLVGFLFNRDGGASEAYAELFPLEGGQRRVLYEEIEGIAFSGKDTAAGKSWETWVKKYEEKKAAEARGESVGSIDLFPEEIE